jgi:phenylalanyl-tRNA synthetase beta subunit
VEIECGFDTPLGRTIVTAFYFQKETVLEVSEAEKWLGDSFTPERASSYIRKLGSTVTVEARRLHVVPAEYRNDFLHPRRCN